MEWTVRVVPVTQAPVEQNWPVPQLVPSVALPVATQELTALVHAVA
ncbi:MAG TPA: hypothetical protein VH083_06920 [Myxococcales bacterium]|nr:hypothetical protein [Myxococcales bacterium]